MTWQSPEELSKHLEKNFFRDVHAEDEKKTGRNTKTRPGGCCENQTGYRLVIMRASRSFISSNRCESGMSKYERRMSIGLSNGRESRGSS